MAKKKVKKKQAITKRRTTRKGTASSRTRRKFKNSDLKGRYSYTLAGTLLDPHDRIGKDPVIHVASCGWIEADGKGGVKSLRALTLNGATFVQEAAGTYDVRPDGSGEAEFSTTASSPPGLEDSRETYCFVLAANCKELHATCVGFDGVKKSSRYGDVRAILTATCVKQ